MDRLFLSLYDNNWFDNISGNTYGLPIGWVDSLIDYSIDFNVFTLRSKAVKAVDVIIPEEELYDNSVPLVYPHLWYYIFDSTDKSVAAFATTVFSAGPHFLLHNYL